MWSFNPSVYLQHAWSSTKTVWGKIALILFYLFIWLTILSSLWSIIFPGSQGASCYLDTLDASMENEYIAGMRMYSLTLIAFLFYADKGGLHVWNVSIVAVYAVLVGFINNSMTFPEACKGYKTFTWVWAGWAILALVFLALEDQLGDSGSPEETQPINV